MNILKVEIIVEQYLPKLRVKQLDCNEDGYSLTFRDDSCIKFTTETDLRNQLLLRKEGL